MIIIFLFSLFLFFSSFLVLYNFIYFLLNKFLPDIIVNNTKLEKIEEVINKQIFSILNIFNNSYFEIIFYGILFLVLIIISLIIMIKIKKQLLGKSVFIKFILFVTFILALIIGTLLSLIIAILIFMLLLSLLIFMNKNYWIKHYIAKYENDKNHNKEVKEIKKELLLLEGFSHSQVNSSRFRKKMKPNWLYKKNNFNIKYHDKKNNFNIKQQELLKKITIIDKKEGAYNMNNSKKEKQWQKLQNKIFILNQKLIALLKSNDIPSQKRYILMINKNIEKYNILSENINKSDLKYEFIKTDIFKKNDDLNNNKKELQINQENNLDNEPQVNINKNGMVTKIVPNIKQIDRHENVKTELEQLGNVSLDYNNIIKEISIAKSYLSKTNNKNNSINNVLPEADIIKKVISSKADDIYIKEDNKIKSDWKATTNNTQDNIDISNNPIINKTVIEIKPSSCNHESKESDKIGNISINNKNELPINDKNNELYKLNHKDKRELKNIISEINNNNKNYDTKNLSNESHAKKTINVDKSECNVPQFIEEKYTTKTVITKGDDLDTKKIEKTIDEKIKMLKEETQAKIEQKINNNNKEIVEQIDNIKISNSNNIRKVKEIIADSDLSINKGIDKLNSNIDNVNHKLDYTINKNLSKEQLKNNTDINNLKTDNIFAPGINNTSNSYSDRNNTNSKNDYANSNITDYNINPYANCSPVGLNEHLIKHNTIKFSKEEIEFNPKCEICNKNQKNS